MKSRIGWLVFVVGVVALIVVVPALAAPTAPNRWGQAPEYPGKASPAPNRQARVRLSGSVVEVGEGTIVLDMPLGKLNVHTDAATRFVIPDVASPSLDDIAVGMKVAVQGRRMGQTFRAQVVLVLPENGGRVRGKVAGVGENSFELATGDKTLSVRVDEQTRFRLPGIENPSLYDLTVDTQAVVAGLYQDDGGLLARLVVCVFPRTATRQGTVVAVGVESLTVQLSRGPEMALTVTGDTTIFVPDVVDATLADVSIGDVVRVQGEIENNAIRASRIIVVPPDAALLIGVVRSVEGLTLQIETRTEQVISVQADTATQIYVPGVESPTLADLRQGDRVRVGGAWLDADDFHGWIIQVGKEGRVGQVQGRLLSFEGPGFVIGSPHGAITVVTDDGTRYRIPDVEEPAFDDLTEGQWVVVRGLLEADGVLRARIVVGRPQR